MTKTKQTYAIVIKAEGKTFELEGEGSSKQNACRQAFKLLLREGKLKRQPRTDKDFLSSFHNVWVTPV